MVKGIRMRIVNLYNPVDKQERVDLLEKLSLYLLGRIPSVLVGDLNCVTEWMSVDVSGNKLKQIINDLPILDIAEHHLGKPAPETYNADRVGITSRIDGFLVSKNVISLKFTQFDVSFSDHMVLNGCVDVNDKKGYGRAMWKMNVSLLKDERVVKEFKYEFGKWRVMKERCANILVWWDWVKI